MKTPILFLLAFACADLEKIAAQLCHPDGIIFSSQAEIDNFSNNNPGCTEIVGNVDISGTGITNLNGLTAISSIGGYLSINSCDALNTLTGLNNLISVGGTLNIAYNMSLTSLNGLNSVASIGGALQIANNHSLTTLSGLGSLASIGSTLSVSFNDALTSLNGLEHLSSIGFFLNIGDNGVLLSLSGIDNINYLTISTLAIHDCPNLSTCEVKSICDYLGNSGIAAVSGNAFGCNTISEIETACQAVQVKDVFPNSMSDIQILPNPTNGIVEIRVKNQDKLELNVRDVFGHLIRRLLLNTEREQIDISELPNGVYLLEIKNLNCLVVKRILKN